MSLSLVVGALLIIAFLAGTRPVGGETSLVISRSVEVKRGDGYREIIEQLEAKGLLRSPAAFELLLGLSGSLGKLKPGTYEISPGLSAWEIRSLLVRGPEAVRVVIPEGSSAKKIDALLARHDIIPEGTLTAYVSERELEGALFPDTYWFFKHADVEDVVQVLQSNFVLKLAPLLENYSSEEQKTILVLASLLEAEVPEYEDRKIVAGILKKRVAAGVPLQVDATICHLKIQQGTDACYPLTPLDFKNPSPYNTYIHQGWPPGPINSPGLFAVKAAIDFKDSSYWYYLSDPATLKTHFSESFDEHVKKKALYL